MRKRMITNRLGIIAGVLVIFCLWWVLGTDISREDRVEGTALHTEEGYIGVTLASQDSQYVKEIVSYMEQIIREENLNVSIVYADWNPAIQIEQIATFIEDKAQAIIVLPIDTKSLLQSFKGAEQANIPIINLNMKVDAISSEYIATYVGSSSTEEGILAAEAVVRLLGEQGGQVAILEGEPGTNPAAYRTQSFIKELERYPNIEILDLACGRWDREESYYATWDLVTQNPELDLIYAHDSNMAMGAYKALVELDKTTIQLVGIGENDEYIQALKEGKIDAIITQPAEFEARMSLYTARDIIKGIKVRPWYKTPCEIYSIKEVLD